MTGADGGAAIWYTIPISLGTGEKTFTVRFAGDTFYTGSTVDSDLTVLP
jgi:hypothetical protein